MTTPTEPIAWQLSCGVREAEPVDGWASRESDGTSTLTVTGPTDEVAAMARLLFAAEE